MKLLQCFLAVCGTVAVSALAYGQTPPRPAVEVRQIPDMWHSVWPADFNEDGVTDLIAARRAQFGRVGEIVVRLGNGDGTFRSSLATGVTGMPLRPADFNADGFIDVVVAANDGAISILPGRGTGRFDAARPIDSVAGPRFALDGDLNADGHRDLVISHEDGVDIHPGLGNFAFGPPMTLPRGEYAGQAGTIADLNGDGRRDLVVAQEYTTVSIHLNRGGLLFDTREIVVANEPLWGITAGDLDADGDADLVLTHTDSRFEWEPGGVEVLEGNGDGTFAAPVTYTTGVNGPLTVVIGHFNGDTRLDVAIGNRSWIHSDQIGPERHYWDSVSIFPGLGDGRLAPAPTFRLDTLPAGETHPDCDVESSCYVNTHHSLKISDVNRDGRTDFITSPGAIVLNRSTAPNRLPIADAGPDQTFNMDTENVRMSVRITEADWEWLQVEWRDQAGQVVSRVPSFFFDVRHSDPPPGNGDWTLTVTVVDARGGVATDSVVIRAEPEVEIVRPQGSTVPAGAPYTIQWDASDNVGLAEFNLFVSRDHGATFAPIAECTNLSGTARSCVWRNPSPVGPGLLRIVATDTTGVQGEDITSFDIVENPGGPGGLPPDWSCAAIGAVAANGTCSQSGGVFTVEGSGADIWGTADELQYAGIEMVGNFSITARVTSVENVNQWTKAGIMIRENTTAGSRHAAFLVTPTTVKGTAFQRRTTQDGSSVSTAGPVTTAPIWLKLVRTGNTIRAFYRKNTTNAWTLTGTQTFTNLAARLHATLVVSSHVDGTLAIGRFDNVVIDETEALQSVDIGGSAAGTTTSNGATLTIEGDGAGIWGNADAFRFHNTPWAGNGTITVRLRSLENTSTGAKAGVMFRESLAAGSKHVMGVVYAAGGVVLQQRGTTGGASSEGARRAGTAPEWVRLTRAGNTFTVSASNDGVAWATVGQTTVTMGGTIYVGLPVTSRVAGTLATAVFDDLWIRP